LTPSPETKTIAARLRTAARPLTSTPQAADVSAAKQVQTAPERPALGASRVPSRPRASFIATLAVTAILAVSGAALLRDEQAIRSTSPYRIAVFPFRVLGDTSWRFLNEGAMDLLDDAIDGIGELRVVAPSAVMNQLRRPGVLDIDQETAREASIALGAGRYILGSVVGAGRTGSASISLYDARNDDQALAVTHVVVTRDSVWQAFRSAPRQLLLHQPLGEGARLAEGIAHLITTDVAARAYLRGEAMLRRGVYDSAGTAYEEAVHEDSTFAPAWYRLTLTRSLGAAGSASESVDQAWRYRSSLGARDRQLVEAHRAYYHGDGKRAEEMTQAVVTAYPDRADAWWLLGTAQWWYGWQLGRSPDIARTALERAVALDPNYREALHSLHLVALYDGRHGEAASLAERAYSRSGPLAYNLTSAHAVTAFVGSDDGARRDVLRTLQHSSEFTIFQSAAFVATYTDSLAAAGRIATLMLDSSRRSPSARARGHVMLALISAARGDRSRSLAEFASARATEPALALTYEAVFAAASRVFTREDARHIRQLVQREPSDCIEHADGLAFLSLPPELSGHCRDYALGLLDARLGEQREGMAYADRLESARVPTDSARLLPDLAMEIRALAAAARGDTASALEALERQQLRISRHFQISSPIEERPIGRFLRAEMLDAMGRKREALGWYQSLTSLSMIEFVLLAETSLREGRIYEELGDTARAIVAYRRLPDRWRDADPEVRALVFEAHERLARLTQRH
jgi:tetratricopeptide (TPR) repeat protein